MAFRMAAVRRSTSGTYTVRKGIPKDVQDEYARLYGYRWEAKFTVPAGLRPQDAEARSAEFISEGEARIASISARQRGERQALSQKQGFALAGQWYRWWTEQREENPNNPGEWEEYFWVLIDRLEDYAPVDRFASSPRNVGKLKSDPEERAGMVRISWLLAHGKSLWTGCSASKCTD